MKNYWWKNTVIYEVYVDKFAKNFRGMTEKLDYLKELGIDCIWLLPHYPSPMVDDGYDVADYMGVRKDLGTLDDFKVFLAKAHEKGIRVITDLVLNHVSVEHPWFIEAAKSLKSPKRGFFLWSKDGNELLSARSPFRHFVASHWSYNKATDDYFFSTYYPQQVDLNWDNPQVFEEVLKVIDFWAELGVDGFRLDAIAHLIKREGTECYHRPEIHLILRKIRSHIDKNHSEVILIAEASGKVEDIIKYFGKGDECHMVFNFPLMSNIHLAIKRNDMSIIENMLARSSAIPESCQWAIFVNNHDEITFSPFKEPERDEMITWLDPDGRYSFKGGSGVSMRLAEIFKGDKDKIINILKILFNLPGSPIVYYGSEIGMRNLDLKEEPVDSRKYVRGEFDWPEAERQTEDPRSLFNQVTQLIKNKKSQ